MAEVTFVIPVAPYHLSVAKRAVDSAKAQTVQSEIVVIHDEEGKGPSWARNRGMEQVHTPFVVFLDADDWIEPNFVERCLAVWESGRYVYTDWLQEDDRKSAPVDPWCGDGQWHPITTLLPTYAVQEVQGFADLPGAEDTEFYWALTRLVKCCGIYLPLPLFHYGKEGQRAKAFVQSDDYSVIMQSIVRRYGRMGCCTDQIIQAPKQAPDGEPGDILARSIWMGNKQVRGMATGRLYPRTGNGALVMVHPADVKAAPHHWQAVSVPQPPQPAVNGNGLKTVQVDGLDALAKAMFPYHRKAPVEIEKVPIANVQPDVARISELARRVYDD